MRSRLTRLSSLMLASLLGACQLAPGPDLPLERLRLPSGFSAEVWAVVPGARTLRVAENGARIWVGTRGDELFAVLDPDRDGVADEVVRVASGLKVPNGLALDRDGTLVVAEQHRIIRLSEGGAVREIVPPGVLPDRDLHGWRYAGLGPDGRLYVSVGAPCDVCAPSGFEGTILRLLPDGHELEIFARGLRSPGGFDWHPQTREMFFTDSGASLTGDRAPPDELNHAPEPGLHFGFPYRYGRRLAYPGFAHRLPPQPIVHPALELDAQAGALGIHFYRGAMFPASYRHDALIALHGSGERNDAAGYRITRVRFEAGRPVGTQVFIDGWRGPDGVAWGRPVDLATLPDGSLLISDDHAGVIYRITYAPPRTRSQRPRRLRCRGRPRCGRARAGPGSPSPRSRPRR